MFYTLRYNICKRCLKRRWTGGLLFPTSHPLFSHLPHPFLPPPTFFRNFPPFYLRLKFFGPLVSHLPSPSFHLPPLRLPPPTPFSPTSPFSCPPPLLRVIRARANIRRMSYGNHCSFKLWFPCDNSITVQYINFKFGYMYGVSRDKMKIKFDFVPELCPFRVNNGLL